MPRSAMIEELTLPELQEFRPEVVVIPVGSTEQHAYHLPYGTDTWRVAEHCRLAAEWANERGGRVVVMPAMPYGVNTTFTAPRLCVVRSTWQAHRSSQSSTGPRLEHRATIPAGLS